MKTINPPNGHTSDDANPAADLVRQKLTKLYSDEPNAKEEMAEAKTHGSHRSKHQKFMYDLSQSGQSLADIQVAWHNYYAELPDEEKHQVWQEFYEEHERRKTKPAAIKVLPAQQETPIAAPTKATPNAPRTVSDIKKQLLKRVASSGNKPKSGHLKSLLFGISSGTFVVVILLFSFFNERFIAPFITPSKAVSNAQIIIDPNATAGGQDPEIIIPKINVEIPVVYDEPSIDETKVEKALERGVVHYATTPSPGETGNGVIFGHSANNIFNKGKYKFAFVLLKRLESGDTFIIQKDGKRYVYRVFSKRIVNPGEVAVLNDGYGKPATFTLITCDPPGTSLNRLVVTGEQITPDPSANIASSVKATDKPKILPSNSPTLWQRFKDWLTS